MPARTADVAAMETVIADGIKQRCEPMYTYTEVAAALKVSVQTVEKWVKQGLIPSPIYLAGLARFSLEALRHIRNGIQPRHTYEVRDSARSADARRGKTVARQKRNAAARVVKPRQKTRETTKATRPTKERSSPRPKPQAKT